MKKKPKIPRAVIGTVLVFVVLLSVFMAGHDLWRQKQAQDTFEDLADLVTAPEDPEESQAESSAPEEFAEAQEPQEEQRNLSLLFEQNADCIGWICIPGTAVDYPLMHTPEDSEKYLRKDFYGAYSINGVPFLDGRCSLESANLIIYGHNMKTGTIFGCLTEYKKAAYYQEHPYIEFDTLYGDAKYEVFAAFAIDVVQDTSFVYNQYVDMDEDTYNDYVAEVIRRSDVDSGIRPEYGEQLLTLSTCEYSSANGRYVVVARKVSS